MLMDSSGPKELWRGDGKRLQFSSALPAHSSWQAAPAPVQSPAMDDNKHYGRRRLVVVAAFDVVGFSALVEADEEKALDAWRALRRAIDPLIAEHGGRIFKSLGDGLLVEFTSPVEATRAALAVQGAAAKMPAGDVL